MNYPTPWQRKTLWAALTGVGLVTIATIVVSAIYLTGRTLSFLQPLLLPVAVAGVMAYLLEPVVAWLVRRQIPRTRAVFIVFTLVTLAVAALAFWVLPTAYRQAVRFGQDVPTYVSKLREVAEDAFVKYRAKIPRIGPFRSLDATPTPLPAGATPVRTPLPPGATPVPSPDRIVPTADKPISDDGPPSLFGPEVQKWMQDQIPVVSARAWAVVRGSIGGFMGVFGFVVGLFIVPVYLFFFLKDADKISENWRGYLPLRASRFKDEVVIVLEQINGYLIAFFRGQLLVSIIDGVLIGMLLLVLAHLPFALLIGLLVCGLCIIPYLGIILCWLPAVIIAALEFKDWQHPLLVTAIFFGVQQIEGFFISPKIVGDSVGLHPMTIIVSVFAWSLLLGGLLGAILAVPLTATLKVLLTRYIWQRRQGDSAIIVPGEAAAESFLVAGGD